VPEKTESEEKHTIEVTDGEFDQVLSSSINNLGFLDLQFEPSQGDANMTGRMLQSDWLEVEVELITSLDSPPKFSWSMVRTDSSTGSL